MNVHKMLPVLSLILTLSNCWAAQQQEQPLADILEEGFEPVRARVFPGLSNKDLANLAQTSKRLHKLVEDPLAERQQEAAIYLSNVSNAKFLDLSNKRTGATSSNDAFKQYVLTQIKDFSIKKPGRWIHLGLRRNSLGEDPAFLNRLIHDIAKEVKEIGIDIVSINLSSNNLTALPEKVFAGLSNLKYLNLDDNHLTTLPEKVFAGLSNLDEIKLSNNHLTALPENVFAGLSNLDRLYLSSNNLTTLRENLFAGLSKLNIIELANNRLTTLPEKVFAGLSNLKYLDLAGTNLTPEVKKSLIISPKVHVNYTNTPSFGFFT